MNVRVFVLGVVGISALLLGGQHGAADLHQLGTAELVPFGDQRAERLGFASIEIVERRAERIGLAADILGDTRELVTECQGVGSGNQ